MIKFELFENFDRWDSSQISSLFLHFLDFFYIKTQIRVARI